MRRLMAAVLAIVATCTTLCADSIRTRSYEVRIDKIVGFKKGTVHYLTSTGARVQKGLKDIVSLAIDGREVFNKAELMVAAKAGDPAKAAELYDAVDLAEAPEWLIGLVLCRKLQALNKAGHVDRAVRIWLEIAEGDMSVVKSLAPDRFAPEGDERNAQAIRLLEGERLKTGNKDLRVAILNLLVKLYGHEGRQGEADKYAAILAGGGKVAKPRPGAGRVASPAQRAELKGLLSGATALIRPDQESVALRQQATAISGKLRQFSRSQLAQALLLLGKAQLYLAGAETDAAKRKQLLAEAGLNLMRVVKFYNAYAGSASEALYLAGRANEELDNIAAARAAYNRVIERYARTTVAKDARKALDGLKSRKK